MEGLREWASELDVVSHDLALRLGQAAERELTGKLFITVVDGMATSVVRRRRSAGRTRWHRHPGRAWPPELWELVDALVEERGMQGCIQGELVLEFDKGLLTSLWEDDTTRRANLS